MKEYITVYLTLKFFKIHYLYLHIASVFIPGQQIVGPHFVLPKGGIDTKNEQKTKS